MERSFTPSAIRKRKWRNDKPELYLKNNRERTWLIEGIDVDLARYMWDEFKECEICGGSGRMCIDHNHETNKIRGVLCNLCNRGLGYFQDSPLLLRKAAAYLENSETSP